MEIKRLSKLSKIIIIDKDCRLTEEIFNMEKDKIIQVVNENNLFFIEFIPSEKINVYESGIDKIEEIEEKTVSNSKINSEILEARKIKLNKDIFAGGKYDNTEIGYIIDTDMNYIKTYMARSTNSFIKDKIQLILDNME